MPRRHGTGQHGPNLTDVFWIYGGTPQNIFKTIKNGAPNGMPPWDKTLQPIQIVELVSFIHKSQQTTPQGAKAPQGKKFKPALGIQPKDIKKAKSTLGHAYNKKKKG